MTNQSEIVKRAEIKEGIVSRLLYSTRFTRFGAEIEADVILDILQSQGIVIQVECPDCLWSQFGDEVVFMTPCSRCSSTGYTTIPLIEE